MVKRRFKEGLHKRKVKGVATPRKSRSKYADEIKTVKTTKPRKGPLPFLVPVPCHMTPLAERMATAQGIVKRSEWLGDEAKAELVAHLWRYWQWAPDGIVAYRELRAGLRWMTADETDELRKTMWRPGDDGHMGHD